MKWLAPASVVTIDTAPATKVERMKALGANLVMTPFDVCWRALEEHAFEGMDGTLVHPFDDHNFIAGHGSMGLEILEDCPDVETVICAIGGGGLIATVIIGAVASLGRALDGFYGDTNTELVTHMETPPADSE